MTAEEAASKNQVTEFSPKEGTPPLGHNERDVSKKLAEKRLKKIA